MKLKYNFFLSVLLLFLFAALTAGVLFYDVRPIGPQGSEVGFASINQAIFEWFGQNGRWDTVSDLISIIGFLSFGLVGLFGMAQWFKRKCLWKVDKEIIALAIFYIVFIALYGLFEVWTVNYRPILEEGALKASYPSTHTFMFIWMLGSSGMVINGLIGNKNLRRVLGVASVILMGLMAIGRLAAGVHWFTDVLGGAILAATLLMFYRSVCCVFKK